MKKAFFILKYTFKLNFEFSFLLDKKIYVKIWLGAFNLVVK